jgi:hypothetical protein
VSEELLQRGWQSSHACRTAKPADQICDPAVESVSDQLNKVGGSDLFRTEVLKSEALVSFRGMIAWLALTESGSLKQAADRR